MWNEEERDKKREEWLKEWYELYKDFKWLTLPFKSLFHQEEDTETEERNDVCIYKTLLHPPKSAPPTTD